MKTTILYYYMYYMDSNDNKYSTDATSCNVLTAYNKW